MTEEAASKDASHPAETLAEVSRLHARVRPTAVALSFDGRDTTYSEFDIATNRVANGLLAAGVKPDERVAILDRNTDWFYEIWLGVAKANAVLVPINARLAGPEIAFILNDANVEILFVGVEFLKTISEIRDQLTGLRQIIVIDERYRTWRDDQSDKDPFLPTGLDDVCLQLYTSGTTGRPKGAQLTNRNLLVAVPESTELWGDWAPNDTFLLVMPLFHIAGCGIGLLGLKIGMRTIVMREFVPARIVEQIEKERATIAFMVPAMLLALLAESRIKDADLSSLRQLIYGASPIPVELLKASVRTFQHTAFVQVYGLTETSGPITALIADDHRDFDSKRMKSCGRAVSGVELGIIGPDGGALRPGEVGEIICRSNKVMKGYWNRPDDNKRSMRNEWFYTGDAGYLDENGYLYIHDRVKDMIVSGGENIYPAEIESALFGHEIIADIAVIGVPDDKWGEAVKALVVLKKGAAPDIDGILRYARQRLAGFKIPKSIEFLPELPRNPAGKILKRQLREKYWRGYERRVN